MSRGPRLGEAGCPGFLRSGLAPCSVVSVLRFLSQGASETRSPLRLLASSPAPIQEVAEILMCCQTRLSEARAASDRILIGFFLFFFLMRGGDG